MQINDILKSQTNHKKLKVKSTVSDGIQTNALGLGFIVKKAKELEQLQKAFQKILPQNLKFQCQIANYDEGLLLIIAETSAWTTRIRYMVPDLIEKLKRYNGFQKLEKIECITRTKFESPPETTQKKTTLSNKSKKLLENVAKTIKDQKLQEALLRLAE